MELVDRTTPETLEQLNLRIPASLKKEIKKIAVTENKDMTDILIEQLKEYVKIHGSGNPVYKLDNFIEPDFRIAPALFSKSEKITNYYKTVKTEQEYKELDQIINLWMEIHNENLRRFI